MMQGRSHVLLASVLAHAVLAVSGQTTAFNFRVRCYDSAGNQISCGTIVAPRTVAQNNAGARFSFSDPGTDPNSGGVGLDGNNTVATNFNSTANDPQIGTETSGSGDTCPIEQFCDCTGTQVTNIIIGGQTANGVIGCQGFIESNTTAVEELQNATAADCAIEIVSTVNVTLSNGVIQEQNVTFCFSDPNIINDEDKCNDNTAVIVVIIVCLILLLVVLVVGAYYLVHGNTLDGAHDKRDRTITNSKIA
eukprot:m.78993 g.78993  ORF g.78993 m.78993 type:complete len:249 (+) comp9263_c0_seq3:33-779(+)